MRSNSLPASGATQIFEKKYGGQCALYLQMLSIPTFFRWEGEMRLRTKYRLYYRYYDITKLQSYNRSKLSPLWKFRAKPFISKASNFQYSDLFVYRTNNINWLAFIRGAILSTLGDEWLNENLRLRIILALLIWMVYVSRILVNLYLARTFSSMDNSISILLSGNQVADWLLSSSPKFYPPLGIYNRILCILW